jgi:hypothetical protein
MSDVSGDDFTSVCLTACDKRRLDAIIEAEFDGDASYRRVINELVDEHGVDHDEVLSEQTVDELAYGATD